MRSPGSAGAFREVGALTGTALAAVVALLIAHPASAVDVTACGQTVPAGAIGIVVSDIACASQDPFIVMLEDRATLDLGGHVLSGGEISVQCATRCVINGAPGTIRDATWGVHAEDIQRARITLINVNFENVTLPVYTLLTPHTRIRGAQVSIAGGFLGMQAGSVRLSDFTATGLQSDYAVSANRVVLHGCTITGNGGVGVQGSSALLRDCSVTGNNGSGQGIDLRTLRRPRLISSTCGRSQKVDVVGEHWDVCTDDPP
jgi:hypothetical protein